LKILFCRLDQTEDRVSGPEDKVDILKPSEKEKNNKV
jgi:hypothetical protein